VISIAIAAVVIISGLLIAREIRFGISMSQMAHVLEAEQGLLADDLPKTQAGRVEKAAADAQFEVLKAAVESEPNSWRAWYRVAIGYDDARDRTRARGAMRTAEKLFRDSSR
jgi:Flp pilus assembly protein TadD